jgi:hypothetical protein
VVNRLPGTGAALAGGAVLLTAIVLYWPTLMPDVGTWDTAEFQAIGPVLGIAHPTGYPTYTLLAWLASVVLQPFGNEAFRANLLSALLVAGSASLLAVVATAVTRRALLGLLAGMAFAVSPLAWSLSTRADAHALHIFLAALLLALLVGWRARLGRPNGHPDRWLLASAAVFGLALGNHALTLLLAPGMGVYVLLVSPGILRRPGLVLACVATVVLVSAAVYAYLPLRSAMDPPLDYADPQRWDSFWYVVLGQQFQGTFRTLPGAVDLVASAWHEIVRDLGILAVLVPAGAVLGSLRHPRLLALTALWFVLSWVFAQAYANAAIERYYAVPLLVACLWVALAIEGIEVLIRDAVSALSGRPPRAALSAALAGALSVLLLVAAVLPVPSRMAVADASHETHARDWLEAVLGALEPDAAVVSWWSYSTPLWYGRWVEGRRDDIVIVDDRDVIDEGFGTAEAAVEHYLDERPVYVVRLERDLPALARRFVLEPVPGVPAPGTLYRVTGRVQARRRRGRGR